jgi:hypothetical protein
MTNAQRQRKFRQQRKQDALRVINGTPEGWEPEFAGQRPPFGPGNRLSVRHGANVPEIRFPVAEKLVLWVVSLPGNEYLREERNAVALEDWAHAQARVVLMRAYADGQSVAEALAEVTEIEETQEGLPSSGVIRRYTRAKSVVSTWRALQDAERHARACADRLGLSPLARVKLGKAAKAQSADLALIWAAEDDDDEAV